MAVLMTAQIPGGTKEMIDGMRPVLDQITSAKGFIVHGNGPSAGGSRRAAGSRGKHSSCPAPDDD